MKKDDKKEIVQAISKTYKVTVNYDKTLAEMINAGNYNWCDKDINDQHFLLEGAGQHEVELVIVQLNRQVENFDVLSILEDLNLDPGKLEHLIAFGAAFPEFLLSEFNLMAPGSVKINNLHSLGNSSDIQEGYPTLHNNYYPDGLLPAFRTLGLSWHRYRGSYGGHIRFLAVRKVTQKSRNFKVR